MCILYMLHAVFFLTGSDYKDCESHTMCASRTKYQSHTHKPCVHHELSFRATNTKYLCVTNWVSEPQTQNICASRTGYQSHTQKLCVRDELSIRATHTNCLCVTTCVYESQTQTICVPRNMYRSHEHKLYAHHELYICVTNTNYLYGSRTMGYLPNSRLMDL